MIFRHVPELKLPQLRDEMTDRGRIYVTPEGNRYPSVTTVLSAGTDHTWLEKWKARVGEDEVKRVQIRASIRGSAVHELAEHYLKNNPDYKKGHMPSNIDSFNRIRPYLDKHIGLIAGLEIPLYSDTLRVAGRSDCVAKWDGVWSIIDFKTSKKIKTKENITNYFLQESCYAEMFYERTGMRIPQIVTVMTVDHEDAIIFVEKAEDYIDEFKKIRDRVSF